MKYQNLCQDITMCENSYCVDSTFVLSWLCMIIKESEINQVTANLIANIYLMVNKYVDLIDNIYPMVKLIGFKTIKIIMSMQHLIIRRRMVSVGYMVTEMTWLIP